jgi:hypothetical protein
LALKAPVPEGWSAHEDGEGNTYVNKNIVICKYLVNGFLCRYFYHPEKELSSWEHPSDKYFRKLARRCKRYRAQSSSQAANDTDARKQIEMLRQQCSDLRSAASKWARERESMLAEASRAAQETQELMALHASEMAALRSVSVEAATRAAAVPALQAEKEALERRVEEQRGQLQAQSEKLSSLLSKTDKDKALADRVRAAEDELRAAQAELLAQRRETEELRARALRDAAAAAESLKRAAAAEEENAKERRGLTETAAQLRMRIEEQALEQQAQVLRQLVHPLNSVFALG